MLSPFGPKIGLPNLIPRPNGDGNDSFLPSKTKSPTFSLEPHELFMERCDFVTRCGSAPTAAVATDTARCKGPYSQLIDCFAVSPRVLGWGWGASVLSYSPNLAHCAVQTSSMQHRGFATRWSEARRLARAATSLLSVREQNGFGLIGTLSRHIARQTLSSPSFKK